MGGGTRFPLWKEQFCNLVLVQMQMFFFLSYAVFLQNTDEYFGIRARNGTEFQPSIFIDDFLVPLEDVIINFASAARVAAVRLLASSVSRRYLPPKTYLKMYPSSPTRSACVM